MVLYHELTHAHDHARGVMNDARLTRGSDVADADAAAGVRSYEYQAMGLGERFRGRTHSENRYRAERVQIGRHGHGQIDGDAQMPARAQYMNTRLTSAPAEVPTLDANIDLGDFRSR